MQPARTFTPEEATRTLPLVRRIVRDILATGSRMRELARHPRPAVEDVHEYDRLADHLKACFREMEDLGCQYKDWSFEIGLVDFPAMIDGKPVLLCWRSDEPGISYYHDWEAGYAGRKRLPE